MLMQLELSHWNPKNAFEEEESFHYYQTELEQILRMLANHPSFVMLTFGNELWSGEVGLARMHLLLEWAQAFGTYDLRGTFAGYEDQNEIQGYINNRYPGATCTDYDLSMEKLRQTYKKPVFSFEVGQFKVFPDFGELDAFHGVTQPVNLELIQEKARAVGFVGTSSEKSDKNPDDTLAEENVNLDDVCIENGNHVVPSTGDNDWKLRVIVEVPALTSVWLDKKEFPDVDVYSQYVSYEMEKDGELISGGSVNFSFPKYFRYLDPQLTCEVVGDEIVVKAQAYAKSVEILNENEDMILSDNYFDMNAGETRVKIISGKAEGLRLRSVYDIR